MILCEECFGFNVFKHLLLATSLSFSRAPSSDLWQKRDRVSHPTPSSSSEFKSSRKSKSAAYIH